MARTRGRARASLQFFSKPTTRRHWDTMLESKRPMKTWCRSNRVLMGQLIRSVIKFFPDEWKERKDSLGEIMIHNCRVCNLDFYANSKMQGLCSDACGNHVWPSHQVKDRSKPKVKSPNGTKDSSR